MTYNDEFNTIYKVDKKTHLERSEYRIEKFEDKDDIYYHGDVVKLTKNHILDVGSVYSDPDSSTFIYISNEHILTQNRNT